MGAGLFTDWLRAWIAASAYQNRAAMESIEW